MAEAFIPEELRSLNENFRKHLTHYEHLARRWKQRHQWSWMSNTILTWLSLLIVVAGLALDRREFADMVLYRLLPVFSFFGMSLTAFQLLVAPQRRWLSYRDAVQRLWNLAMFHRARLFPFHDPRDFTQVGQKLKEIVQPLEARSQTSWRSWARQLLDDYRPLQVPAGRYPNLADEGLWPNLSGCEAYLNGRLRAQKHWYLSKARKYQTCYFALLATIGLIYLFNFVWCLTAGKAFWVIAGTTAVNLMLFAVLDFLNYGPLWNQYRQTAGELQAIENDFLAQARPFDLPDEGKRLERLVEQVEYVLSKEFYFWIAINQQWRPADKAEQPLPQGYQPQPVRTATVELPVELKELGEKLARNVHDLWARQRLSEGWRLGSQRDDLRKLHPCLVDYDKLPESEKEYDRMSAMETLKAICALGYRIDKG